ncbi:hypothetical protein [Sphaerisporangium sp. NPDC051011]|uniref:hypothetical protein n=1 Tax=Sphaerisporangium sp. NPDC051011 TaxID=3155792 RepID=UPI0033CEA6EB
MRASALAFGPGVKAARECPLGRERAFTRRSQWALLLLDVLLEYRERCTAG